MERPVQKVDMSVAEMCARLFFEKSEALCDRYAVASVGKPWASLPPLVRGHAIATMGEVLSELGLLGLHIRLDEQGEIVVRSEDGTRVFIAAVKPADPVLPPLRVINGDKTVSKKEVQSRAVLSGFTGNVCKNCGSSNLIRTGSCETCSSCGSTSSCG